MQISGFMTAWIQQGTAKESIQYRAVDDAVRFSDTLNAIAVVVTPLPSQPPGWDHELKIIQLTKFSAPATIALECTPCTSTYFPLDGVP